MTTTTLRAHVEDIYERAEYEYAKMADDMRIDIENEDLMRRINKLEERIEFLMNCVSQSESRNIANRKAINLVAMAYDGNVDQYEDEDEEYEISEEEERINEEINQQLLKSPGFKDWICNMVEEAESKKSE